MVFDFFKKLLMSRQLTFERGQIKVANEISIMVHGPALVNLTDMLIRTLGRDGIKYIYNSSKESGKILAKAFQNKYGMKGMKLASLIKDLTEMAGWGKSKFINLDISKKTMIIVVTGSPFAQLTTFKNKKMCHMSRGFAAGAASVLFKTNVDCIETKCAADGSNFCEFIIQEKKNLKNKKLVKQQLS